MSLARFFIPPPELTRETILLTGEEARHATVRRLKIGETVSLFDAAGGEALARVENRGRGQLELKVTDRPAPLPPEPVAVTLVLALIHWERFRLVLEKATELGVRAVWPARTERGQALPGLTRTKMERVVLESLKQCRRSFAPEVAEPENLKDLLAKTRPVADKILLAPAGRPLLAVWKPPAGPGEVAVLVGPEGGFTAGETAEAEAAGFSPAGLSRAVLRTETAALAALALILAGSGCPAREGQ